MLGSSTAIRPTTSRAAVAAGDGSLTLVLGARDGAQGARATRDRRRGERAQIDPARRRGPCQRHPPAADGRADVPWRRLVTVGDGHDLAPRAVVVPPRAGRAGPRPPE